MFLSLTNPHRPSPRRSGSTARKLRVVAPNDPPPTLASLRRNGRGRSQPTSQPAYPGLFDLVSPVISEPAALDPLPAPRLLDVIPIPEPGSKPAEPGPAAPPASPDRVSPATVPSQIWTVTGLVRQVRSMVEQGYARVTVEGEISNWRPAGSGHCYFTLKDSGAQLSAVLFRRQASLLRFRPKDGDAVKLHGQLSIYESRGQMQLIAEWMEQAGLGALLAEVQRLKDQLRREGLFDRKRPLPPFPRCIGVITSLHGAALRDIVKVCRRRHAAVQLLIYPAAVQGPNCPAEIAAGLRWFNAHPDRAEVVLVARGGGSWEDLHGFDDEQVARAIAASILPVITGIGHATDATLADAAADLCAPTPSAAAELLTAAHHGIEDHVLRLHGRLLRAGSFELLRAQQRLGRLSAQTVLRRVEDSLNRRAQRLDELAFRAQSTLSRRLRSGTNRLKNVESRLTRQNPAVRLGTDRRRLELLQSRLERASALLLTGRQRRSEAATHRLEALSPLRVLDRGYALVYDSSGHLLRSASSTQTGQILTARLAEGSLQAEVLAPVDQPGT